ncbi:MAG: PD-(D/E)XK nuclease family protein [Synergistales bacterium]|nr:PD-(D/E)XK nuclease family protein [Synergistales bacterium]
MPIIPYKQVKEIEPLLRKFTGTRDRKRLVFLVPALKDLRKLEETLSEGPARDRRPYRIWRWSDLYRDLLAFLRDHGLHEQGRLQIDPPDHWLIIRYLLKDMFARDGSDKAPKSATKQGFIPLAGEILKEILREEISPEEISEALGCNECRKGNIFSRMEEPEGLFCRLFHAYVGYLSGDPSPSLMDSAQIATVTGETIGRYPEVSGTWLKNIELVLLGFMSFNHSQLNLVRKLIDKAGRVTILTPLPGMDRSYTLLEQLKDVDVLWDYSGKEPLKALILECPDRRLELETLAREFILWREGRGTIYRRSGQMPFPGWSEIGLTVPSRSLDLALEALSRYGIPYNLSEGRKVSETLLWDLVKRIWHCYSEKWPGERTFQLLKEPFFGDSAGLSHKNRSALPEGRTEWMTYLSGSDLKARDNFEHMIKFTGALAGGLTPSDILGSVIMLAHNCGWEGKAASYILEHPSMDERCRELNASIRELENKVSLVRDLEQEIGPAGKEKLKGQDAFAFLRNWAEETTISSRIPMTDSLELHTDTPPVLSQREVWAITGASSDEWPGILRESPLLTDKRKEYLHEVKGLHSSHLPLAHEKRSQREALFNRILACGSRLTLITSGLSDLSGKPLKITPFLHRSLESQEGRTPWIGSAGNEGLLVREEQGQLFPLAEGPFLAGMEIPESLTDMAATMERVLPVRKSDMETPASVSLSAMDDWLLCPYRYYCRHILKIYEKPEPGLDAALLGEGIHELWKRVWSEKAKTLKPVTELWKGIFLETFSIVYPQFLSESPLNRHLSRILFQTGKLAELQDQMEGLGIRDPGVPPLTEKILPSLEVGGVLFKGRADRIDILRDGTCVMLDYKSGSSSRYRNSLQLAAYGLLHEKGGNTEGCGAPLAGYGYICLADGRITGSFRTEEARQYLELGNRRSPDLEERLDETERSLIAMAECLKEGIFEPDYNSEACRYCSYYGLCRRSEKPFPLEDDRYDQKE